MLWARDKEEVKVHHYISVTEGRSSSALSSLAYISELKRNVCNNITVVKNMRKAWFSESDGVWKIL